MKIAIAGSGALGSGFGAKLFQHGYDVSLIDGWEPQVTSIQQEGLHIDINGSMYHFDIPMYRFSQIPQSEVYDIVFLFLNQCNSSMFWKTYNLIYTIKQSLYVQ